MRKILTKRKHAWAKQFKHTGLMRGTTLNYNASAQDKYVQALFNLIDPMCKTVKKEILLLFKSNTAKKYFAQDDSISGQANILTNDLMNRFNQLFNSKAKMLAVRMVNQQDQVSKTNLHQSLKDLSGGLLIKTDFLTGDMQEILSAAVNENVSLIKSISSEYLTDVKGAVMRSITTGNGLETLMPALERLEGVTKRRAKNIALDQTRKVYNHLNAGRMDKVGLEKYEWVHSGGGQHPREDHIAMSGNIYSLKMPPVIDLNTGERGIPGQAINCKCTMRPVVEFNMGKM